MASNIHDQSEHRIRLSDMIEEPKRMLPPIKGFEELDIVSLEKSVESLTSIVPEIDQMVYIVKQNCTNPANDLTPDESASIMLYSMEWSLPDQSFYFILNKTLRSENRQLLKPWFLYLRLFIHSLSKLPSFDNKTIYRGIKIDLSKDYYIGKKFVWWAFSSCTDSIKVLENEEFFGQTGTRTLFLIQCHTGKDIRNHSIFPTENEVLLVAARQFQVISILNAGNDLHLIQIQEIQPPFPFISCSPVIPSKTLIYQNKKLQDIINKYSIGSEINLDDQHLNDQDIEIVVDEAIINKRCKKLSLEHNQITSQGALIIANALNSNNQLESLKLFHNYLSDIGVQHLSKALSINNSNLKILGLGSNYITDNGIEHLTQMIRTNQSLNILGLVYNEITDQGVKLLAETIMHSKTNLQILHLSKNQSITDVSIDYLIRMLERNVSLKEIWMQNCHLSDHGKQRLRQFIRSKKNFTLEF